MRTTPGLRASHRRDGALVFKCDDCGDVLVMDDRSPLVLDGTTVRRPRDAWSVTQRRQRCPDCTDVARAKGWVK